MHGCNFAITTLTETLFSCSITVVEVAVYYPETYYSSVYNIRLSKLMRPASAFLSTCLEIATLL